MTNFCKDCGAEFDDANYCPECGTEVKEQTESTQIDDTVDGNTGSCEQCGSQIRVEAIRCPECGYEPGSSGIIGSTLVFLSFSWVLLMALILLIAWLLVPFGELALTDGLYGTVGLLLFASPGIVVLYLKGLAERKTPTGETKTWREAWDEA
jgi:DNA-directed RNA polymerase subunit RPC12/RpoP